MMVPNARHFDQTWVVHSLNQGFELEDVWEFPIKAGPQHNLEQFRECFQRVFERLETEGISGFLFRLRFFLGQIFGWDKQPPIRNIMRAGSLRERYVVSGHGHLPDPETGDRLPFEWVYRLPDEYLSEIDNKTCHAALHGGWVPLAYMFPDADIPIAQLSIQCHLGPAHHLKMGQALEPLRDQNVLIIGSGNITHGRRAGEVDDPAFDWVSAFSEWAGAAIDEGRTDDLVNFRKSAPFAFENHPTDDHYVPLLIALGAGGKSPRIEKIHSSFTYRTIAMDSYAFH